VAHVCGVCDHGCPVGVGMVGDPMVDRMTLPQFIFCSLLGALMWWLLAVLVFSL
jgi:hypothetical protein